MNFVAPMIRLAMKGMGLLAEKSDRNPKSAAFMTVFGTVAGYLGIDPGSLQGVGTALVVVGQFLQGIGGQ